jgi:hypothetical protein
MKKSELKEIIKASFLAEAEDSKKGNIDMEKHYEGAIKDTEDHIADLKSNMKDFEDKLAKLKKDYPKDVKEEMKKDDDVKEEMRGKRMEDDVKEEMKDDDVKEMMRGARYEEDDVKEMMRGQKFEEDDIKEQEDVDVEDDVDVDVKDEENVDVDVEKDIDVDDVSKESDIEVKSEIPGESSDVAAILGLLTKAQEKAESMGDEKLLDQIGNTITYYTRAHVVKATNEDLESGEYGAPIDAKLDVTKGDSDVAGVLGAEAALNLQEVERFKKLAGLIK